jgi:6-pyruvoyltetrahydropterin/6-carboxytetrahydropterin synthase
VPAPTRFTLRLAKSDFKFAAAHFTWFADGTAERLHGHNYRVFVEIAGQLTEHGLVLDFKAVKPLVRAICDELDEHWLVPGEHAVLRWSERPDGTIEVRYQERIYCAPREDVLVLPINNTSSENLATWFGRELARRLALKFPRAPIESLRVAVEETTGQRGVYAFAANPRP